jgi:hypothetical protein
MQIRIEATVNARDREEVGKAMAELYAELVKAVEAPARLPLPHIDVPSEVIKGTYPKEQTNGDDNNS